MSNVFDSLSQLSLLAPLAAPAPPAPSDSIGQPTLLALLAAPVPHAPSASVGQPTPPAPSDSLSQLSLLAPLAAPAPPAPSSKMENTEIKQILGNHYNSDCRILIYRLICHAPTILDQSTNNVTLTIQNDHIFQVNLTPASRKKHAMVFAQAECLP
uniref:Uncharacterized protein n=1 Tax=Ditylenchus dipsaci TaxID=166011 RepID=A0A915DP18_9BILA